jgi:hypothetical protein
VEAIFLTTFVLISQNRMASKWSAHTWVIFITAYPERFLMESGLNRHF